MKRFFPTNIWFSTDYYGSWVHWRRHCSPGKSHKWLWVFPLPPHWRTGQNALQIIQIVLIRECYIENFSTLIRRSPARKCCIDEIDQHQILHKFSFFVDHFNAVQLLNLALFKNLHSLLSVSLFCFWCCASFRFLMAVICSPSCIVTALALHRVSVECLLTKNGTRNFLKFSRFGIGFVVFRQQLSYASSSLPPNVTYVLSGTMRSLSIFPLELWSFW